MTDSVEVASTTSTLRGPPSTRFSHRRSSGSSTSSMPGARSDSGSSDCTNPTPWEFYEHPLPLQSSRHVDPDELSPDGPFVARITVETSAASLSGCREQLLDRTSPRQHHTSRIRDVGRAFREEPSAVKKKDGACTSSTDDCKTRNQVVSLPETQNAAAVKRKNNGRDNDEIVMNGCCSTSHDQTADLAAAVTSRCDQSAMSNNCASSAKQTPKLPATADTNRCAVSAEGDRANRHVTAKSGDYTSHNGYHEAPSKQRRTQENDCWLSEDRVAVHRAVDNLTAAACVDDQRNTPAARRNENDKVSLNERASTAPTVGCTVTSSNSRTAAADLALSSSAAASAGRATRRRDAKDSEDDVKMSTKVPQCRRSSRHNPLTRDVAFYRHSGDHPTAEANSSNQQTAAGVTLAGDSAKVLAQGQRPCRAAGEELRSAGYKDKRQAIGATVSSAEEERRKVKLARMKHYCLQQLAQPSQSAHDLGARRRSHSKRHRTAACSPDSGIQTLRSGAAGLNAAAPARRASSKHQPHNSHTTVAGHAYPCTHEYASLDRQEHRHSTKPGRHKSPPISHAHNDKSLKVSITDRSQQPSNDICRNKHDSQTVDRNKLSDNVRRAIPPRKCDPRSYRTNCSSVNSEVCLSSRVGGRLSVTISNNNSPELPEVLPRQIDSGRTIASGRTDHRYSQLSTLILTDRKLRRARHQGRMSDDGKSPRYGGKLPSSSSSSSSSTSSEGTIHGGDDEDRESDVTSVTPPCGTQGVDAAVQVELGELESVNTDAGGTNDPLTIPQGD